MLWFEPFFGQNICLHGNIHFICLIQIQNTEIYTTYRKSAKNILIIHGNYICEIRICAHITQPLFNALPRGTDINLNLSFTIAYCNITFGWRTQCRGPQKTICKTNHVWTCKFYTFICLTSCGGQSHINYVLAKILEFINMIFSLSNWFLGSYFSFSF